MGRFNLVLSSALIIFSILVAGCQGDQSLNESAAQGKNSTADNIPEGPPVNDLVLLRMPAPLNIGGRDVSVRKLVSPNVSTNFKGTMEYVSISGRLVYVDVEFNIPSNAVSDTVTVTMSLDTVNVGVRFEPEGLQFAIASSIDVTVLNIDPFSWGSIAFVYVAPDGNFEPIAFEKIEGTGNLGKLKLKKGVIGHFSQYAFGRLTAEKNKD